METPEKTEKNDALEIDLREVYYLLRSRLAAILAGIILCAAVGGLICEFAVTPLYASTAKLYIINASGSSFAGISLADLQIGASLTSDYQELIQSRPAVEEVIEALNLDITYEQMLSKLSIQNKENTRILAITIQDTDPLMAKQMVDKFAEVAKKRVSQVMNIEEPSLVEEGHVMETSMNQNMNRYVAVGGITGAVLMISIILLRYLMDDSIHSAEDIERYLNLNTLAMIPMGEEEYNSNEKGRRSKKNGRRRRKQDSAKAG